MGAVVLIGTGLATSAEVGKWLAWYLTVAGVGYAGRLPIHVFGNGYVSLHPSLHKLPELRRKLNFLTSLNAISVVLWLAGAWFLLTQPATLPLWVEAVMGTGFYVFVMVLGMETVTCARALDLTRGTEFVCQSPIGRKFKILQSKAPDGSLIQDGMNAIKTTPPYQASWFLALVAAALVALPSGVGTAKTTEKVLGKQVPVVQESPGQEEASQGTGGENRELAADPTYEEECPHDPVPGEPAPAPRSEQLQALWLGGGGIEGVGGNEAGCAKPATPVLGHPDVWIARGFCGTTLRSLGVAAPGYMPSLLFQQAARFALAKARAGELRGASSRWPVGEGDLYVIDTDIGSFVLVRPKSSGGSTEPSGDLPCERFEEVNVEYDVIPPGLISLWLEVGADGWVWPAATGKDDPESGAPALFEFRDQEGNVVADARCYSDTRCAAWIDGTLHVTSDTLFTSLNVLESMTG
ncbi:MAG: hypothetical protein ACTHO8_02430 [Solirubrobacterales bacterium]